MWRHIIGAGYRQPHDHLMEFRTASGASHKSDTAGAIRYLPFGGLCPFYHEDTQRLQKCVGASAPGAALQRQHFCIENPPGFLYYTTLEKLCNAGSEKWLGKLPFTFGVDAGSFVAVSSVGLPPQILPFISIIPHGNSG